MAQLNLIIYSLNSAFTADTHSMGVDKGLDLLAHWVAVHVHIKCDFTNIGYLFMGLPIVPFLIFSDNVEYNTDFMLVLRMKKTHTFKWPSFFFFFFFFFSNGLLVSSADNLC